MKSSSHYETSNKTRHFHYFDLIMASFITLLLCSNLIGASKVCEIYGVTFGGTLLFFPLSYLFGDILTEVYGYKYSRKVVWAGFISLIFASFVSWFIVALPPSPGWENQKALEAIFHQTPRITLASLTAYFVGEFMNSYVMAKMKILTQGKWLWTRILGSTLIGEGIDCLIFYPLAFFGEWQNHLIIKVMISSYFIKITWEMLMTPLTYKIVRFLKLKEDIDHYDYDTNFSPFKLKK